ncbi:MAG: hypothetical protein ACTHMJ_18600, partial [Thermomicrobiales bacterium]
GNSLATAVLLESLLAHRDHLKKLVVASSMSIYGEGAYHCSTCGVVYPRIRPIEQLRRHEWELRCDRCHQIVSPMPTTEDKPLFPTSIYAVTKRDHEEMCLTFGLAYGIPIQQASFDGELCMSKPPRHAVVVAGTWGEGIAG